MYKEGDKVVVVKLPAFVPNYMLGATFSINRVVNDWKYTYYEIRDSRNYEVEWSFYDTHLIPATELGKALYE